MTDTGRYCFISVISICAMFVALLGVNVTLGLYLMAVLFALPLTIVLYCILVFIEDVVQIGFDASFLTVYYEKDPSGVSPPERPCWERTLARSLRHNDLCRNDLWRKRSQLYKPIYYFGTALFLLSLVALCVTDCMVMRGAGPLSADALYRITGSDIPPAAYAAAVTLIYCIVALYPAYQIIRRTPWKTLSMMLFEPHVITTEMAVEDGIISVHERERLLFERGGIQVFLPGISDPVWIQKSAKPEQNRRRTVPIQLFRGYRIGIGKEHIGESYCYVFMDGTGRLVSKHDTVASPSVRIFVEGETDVPLDTSWRSGKTCSEYFNEERRK